MSNFFDILDKYKYGLLATFAAYVALFMYLQMESYTQYFPIQPFHEGAYVEVPEEIEIKPENVEIPEDFNPADVKNISRDKNDTREKSDDKWFQNKSLSQVEQSVKDYEKKLFEESGGEAQRKKIQQEMEDRKKQNNTNNNKTKDNNATTGGNKSYSGDVMVDWVLSNRIPHQNNNWYVRNPGYTCGYSSGRVTVQIKVNQNGDVVFANYDAARSSNATTCMVEQAVKYAKLSRFGYSGSAPKMQDGTITYTFISQ